jgi:hypothetical protein
MKTFIILISCLIPNISLAADPWSRQDIALEGTFIFLHIVDWGQTRDISKNPDKYYEGINPFLGEHPSTERVDLWFVTTTLAHIVITNYLPSKYRPYFQGVTIGITGAAVIRNFSIGLSVNF